MARCTAHNANGSHCRNNASHLYGGICAAHARQQERKQAITCQAASHASCSHDTCAVCGQPGHVSCSRAVAPPSKNPKGGGV